MMDDGAKNRDTPDGNLLPLRFPFQQVNDLKHLNVLEGPSQSSDLDPTENLWYDLKIAEHEQNHPT